MRTLHQWCIRIKLWISLWRLDFKVIYAYYSVLRGESKEAFQRHLARERLSL